jgi:hypothetical protein
MSQVVCKASHARPLPSLAGTRLVSRVSMRHSTMYSTGSVFRKAFVGVICRGRRALAASQKAALLVFAFAARLLEAFSVAKRNIGTVSVNDLRGGQDLQL